MRKIGRWLMILCLVLCACGTGESHIEQPQGEQSQAENENAGKKLKVYISYNGTVTTTDGVMQLSGPTCTVGGMGISDELVYINLIEQFAEENDIELDLAYGKVQDQMSRPITYYDVLIGNTYEAGFFDLFLHEMLQGDYLMDMTPLAKEDVLYGGTYIEPIMKAGKVDERQLIFPLSFNLNMLYTSEESLDRHEMNISADSTFDELIDAFAGGWNQANDTVYLFQPNYSPYLGTFYCEPTPYQTFLLAGGSAMEIDEHVNLIKLYESFMVSDLNSNLDDIRLHADLQDEYGYGIAEMWVDNANTWRLEAAANPSAFEIMQEQVACYTSGNTYNEVCPFVMQTMYYESLYREIGEDFTPIAIPEKDKAKAYQAIISNYGIIPKDSTEPELAFELLQYLASAEISPLYDLPVNKEQITKTLSTLQSTDLTVVDHFTFDVYTMQPLSEETASYLQEVIDHIDHAVLFDNKLWYDRNQVLAQYILGTMELHAAAQQMIEIDKIERGE